MSARPEYHADQRLSFLQRRLQAQAGPAFSLRFEQAEDLQRSRAIYAVTRREELARVDWPEAARQAFISQQFQAQYQHYRSHYSRAMFLMIWSGDEPVGRLYLSPGSTELRLMDIIVLPAWRRQGLARALLSAVLDWVLGEHLELTLHVEANNPARDWYQRLGFEDVELRGVYWFMRLPVERAPAAQLKLIS